MPSADNAIARRLRSYWKLEAGNVVFVPAFAGVLVWQDGSPFSVAFWIAALACSGLLVVGTIYWWALLRKLEGKPVDLDRWIPRLAALEIPALTLSLFAASLVCFELMLTAGNWNATRIAAACLAGLALLEYVNYYRVQLQHFDNGADFRRLLSGRGFRKAHLARDIAAWRAGKQHLQ